jgi:hypothetical protein
MYQEITQNMFVDSFSGSYEKNFSYYGKIALFDYLTGLEEDTREEMELDPIAICCDFTEYEDFEEIKKQYPNIESIEDLRDNTQVIECEKGSIIIQNY